MLMKKIYAKLEKTSDVLRYFLINEWDISNTNVVKLWEKLNEHDKIMYNFDINSIDTENYFKNLMIGLKKIYSKRRYDQIKVS
ncbi:hypothetical protein NQ314_004247 [Rhamnusium bicolor]|uniref:Fatty acyl-CoA reductase C-terminal domain-containing protein n=1 Tax=Rhamnusium bicolor TaxID=1586634 RepID=A0AAV8ZL06_9CUCU|nr:hypothetical protein NQ314_004247 [Rhamnusium bicolor]